VRENLKLQIRGEFFNLPNRVNFGLPNSTVGDPTYGIIQSAADARVIQLALRLSSSGRSSDTARTQGWPSKWILSAE